jgi:hypothetical protein
MTEQILTFDHVVLVRWRQLTVPGLERAVRAVDDVCASGRAPIFIGLVGNGVAPPTGTVNVALTAAFEVMRARCATVNLVLDGTGMRFSAVCKGAAAMFLLKGDRRTKMYSSLQEALNDQARDHAVAVLAAAEAAAITQTPEPMSA